MVPRSGNYSAVDGCTNLLIGSTTKHILDQKEPNSRGYVSGAGKASPMFQGEVKGILGQFVKGYYVMGPLPLIEGQSALYCEPSTHQDT